MGDNDRIGIMGGTFNPIHYGHLRVSEEVREGIGLGKVLFVPSGNPPLKARDLAPAEHRFEMARRAVATNPHFELSDIECREQKKSYTVETLAALRAMHPGKEFYFILGIDSFLEIPSWHRPEKLLELTNFVVVSRPGFSFSTVAPWVRADLSLLSSLDTSGRAVFKGSLRNGRDVYLMNVTSLPISATTIRGLIRKGKSVKYLLPESVEYFIISHKLYSEGSDHL
ncbi:MAG: nicotinate-nucleotide adenylyltransferase [Nitrospirae bacterium]|nr:nicotinate-nucleotide adenylyltransferase [Nitrospirota bacterium]